MERTSLNEYTDAELASELRRRIRHTVKKRMNAEVASLFSRTVGDARVGMVTRVRNVPSHCVYPGCVQPHRYARYSFLCLPHSEVSKEERQQIYKNYRANQP